MKFIKAVIPSSIETTLHVKSHKTQVMGDPTHMHQILMNLCTNGAQAMASQKGRLTVTLEEIILDESKAKVLHLLSAPHALLTVRDTGPGIPSELLPRIFDPFFTTKGVGQGTGLGLSVVHGLVKGMGGAVDVKNDGGQGCSFHVYLPLLQETLTPSEVQPLPELKALGLRVLVVDDEISLVEITRQRFIAMGCQVTAVHSSEVAMTLLNDLPQGFDLVITDLTMPNINGVDLRQFIRKINPTLPVVLTSGLPMDILSQDTTLQEFDGFLCKPVLIEELAKVLRTIGRKQEA